MLGIVLEMKKEDFFVSSQHYHCDNIFLWQQMTNKFHAENK
jgi:hypothetical protein